MTGFGKALSIFALAVVAAAPVAAQSKADMGDNAALRYWSAFAQMQDLSFTDEQIKDVHQVLEGTAAYDDSKYKDLLQKNQPALHTMARGATLPRCDWGLDYQLGSATPVDYVRKSGVLGNMNVLYSYHLLSAGNTEAAVHVLAAGLRFSHDVANNGTLFATLTASYLMEAHLRAIGTIARAHTLSSAQRQFLHDTLAPFGPDGVDWQAAMHRELGLLSPSSLPTMDTHAWPALKKITPLYMKVFESPGTMTELQQEITAAPQALQDAIPNPKRALAVKQELAAKLGEARSQLQ